MSVLSEFSICLQRFMVYMCVMMQHTIKLNRRKQCSNHFKNSFNHFEKSLKDIAVALKSFGNLLIDLQNALQSFRTH